MKTVFSNSELVHIYAKQSQEVGRNPKGSMFFEGAKLYSYTWSHCISNILPNGIILYNSDTYSVTTSKHHSEVRYALNHHFESYSMPSPELPNIRKNLRYCQNTFGNVLKNHLRAKKYSYLSELTGLKNTLDYLLKNFKWKTETKKEYRKISRDMSKTLKALESDPSELKKALRLEDKKIKADKKQRKLELEKENIQKIEDWKKGKIDRLSIYLDTPYLRLSKDKKNIETSKGAKVSIKAGKILWGIIKAGKDIQGHNIEGYTVISLNGTLKIGCHNIPRDEVDRFGEILDSLKTK